MCVHNFLENHENAFQIFLNAVDSSTSRAENAASDRPENWLFNLMKILPEWLKAKDWESSNKSPGASSTSNATCGDIRESWAGHNLSASASVLTVLYPLV